MNIKRRRLSDKEYNKQRYRITVNDYDFVVTCDDAFFLPPLMLDRDDEHQTIDQMMVYLTKHHKELMKRLRKLAKLDRTLNLKEEKELRLLLEEVLSAHATLRNLLELEGEYDKIEGLD